MTELPPPVAADTVTGPPRPPPALRYTNYVPPPALAPAKAKAQSDGGLITAGIAFALLLPIIGFLFGVVLLLKNRVGPGLGVMALCPIGFIIGLMLLGATA